MANNSSNYLNLKIAALLFGNTAYTIPGTYYFGLWTAALSNTSTGATAGEVSGGSYARVAVTNNTTNFPAPTGSGTANTVNGTVIQFVTATANWGTVTYCAALDSSTLGAGNIIIWGQLTASQVVNNGNQVQFNVNAWSLTIG